MKEHKTETDKKSEEVQDIIDRMPTYWTWWVAGVLSVLMAGVVVMGFLIEYPDTVSGEVSISAGKAPVRIVSNSTGRLHLMKANRAYVKAGEVIGFIDNAADYHDVCKVMKLLENEVTPQTTLLFPADLSLGDLSADYNGFALAYKEYDILRHTTTYANMRSSLHKQIDAAHEIVDNIDEELTISQKSLDNIANRLYKDSLLYEDDAISEEELKNRQGSYLSALQSSVGLKSSKLSKMAEIDQNMTEIAKVNVTESEALKKAYMNMLAKRNVLKDNAERWLESFVMKSTIDGKLEYLGFWRDNVYVSATQELFSVVPERNTPVGELYIPISGAGKVCKGQEVNIKISDFPYDEYGLVKGKVVSISSIPNKLKTDKGTAEAYLVLVRFPQGLVTNFGKELKVNFEAKGQADIITKPKRLIERLFDNLKAKGHK